MYQIQQLKVSMQLSLKGQNGMNTYHIRYKPFHIYKSMEILITLGFKLPDLDLNYLQFLYVKNKNVIQSSYEKARGQELQKCI